MCMLSMSKFHFIISVILHAHKNQLPPLSLRDLISCSNKHLVSKSYVAPDIEQSLLWLDVSASK